MKLFLLWVCLIFTYIPTLVLAKTTMVGEVARQRRYYNSSEKVLLGCNYKGEVEYINLSENSADKGICMANVECFFVTKDELHNEFQEDKAKALAASKSFWKGFNENISGKMIFGEENKKIACTNSDYAQCPSAEVCYQKQMPIILLKQNTKFETKVVCRFRSLLDSPKTKNEQCQEFDKAEIYLKEMNKNHYKCNATLIERNHSIAAGKGESLVNIHKIIHSDKCLLLKKEGKDLCPSGTVARNFLDSYKICILSPSAVDNNKPAATQESSSAN